LWFSRAAKLGQLFMSNDSVEKFGNVTVVFA